jgi:hypothetical protein
MMLILKIIENRIAVYRNETEPVKTFYQNQNKYIAINGVGTMDEILIDFTQKWMV